MNKITLIILFFLIFIINQSNAQNLSAYFYGDNKQDVVKKIKFLDSLSTKVDFIILYCYLPKDTSFFNSIIIELKNEYNIDKLNYNNNLIYCRFNKYNNNNFGIQIRNPLIENYNNYIINKNIRLYNDKDNEIDIDDIEYEIINNNIIKFNNKSFKFNNLNDLYQIIKEN